MERSIVIAPAQATTCAAIAVNPNPTVERTAVVDHLTLGEVNRVQRSIASAGGKGATVARALSRLGHPALCVGPLGGQVGKQLEQLAQAEQLPAAWTWVAGETRTNTTVVSSNSESADTLINEIGPTVSADEWQQLCATIYAHVEANAPVSISGSTPPGVTGEQLGALVDELRERNVNVFIDSHGMALAAMIERRPFCVKVNDDEAAQLLGHPVDGEEAQLQAVRALAKTVTGLAILTLGAAGALVADTDGLVAKITPPTIEFVSAVGSGDCFLAGLVAGLCFRQLSTIDAVRFASSAGALNAASMRQGHLDPVAVTAAMDQCVVQVIDASGGHS